MKKYEITQTLIHTIIVEAENEEEAIDIAYDKMDWYKLEEKYEVTEEW